MTSNKNLAFDLLKRLIAGEDGEVQQHLMWLLKRRANSDENDEFYRQEMPPSLRDVRLTNKTKDEAVAAIALQIAKDPTEALVVTMCASESGESLRAAAELLIKLFAACLSKIV